MRARNLGQEGRRGVEPTMKLFKKGVINKRHIFTIYLGEWKHTFTVIAPTKKKAKLIAPSIAYKYMKNLGALKLEWEGVGEMW